MPVEIRRPFTRMDPSLPYGYNTRVLAIVPAIAVTLTPANASSPFDRLRAKQYATKHQ